MTIYYKAAMWASLLFLLGLMACTPVRAQSAPVYTDSWRYNTWSWFGSTPCEECRRIHEIRRRKREREAWRRRQEREHYEARHHKIYREERGDRGNKCEDYIAVVGDQYASEAGAQGEADKAFMQTARWQFGERYMSRENAADATYECGRSSVGSVVGQVFYRCRLKARPCAPQKSRAN